MSEFAPHSVEITTASTPVRVPLASLGSANNIETAPDGAGALYDQARSVTQQAPVFGYSTEAVPAILSLLGMTGVCLDASGAVRTITHVQERKTDCKSGAAGASTHRRTTISTGLVTPLELTASLGTNVRLSFQVDALTDGTNAPFTIAAGTLPTPLDLSQYTLGAVRMGGVSIEDARDLSLSFGIQQQLDRQRANTRKGSTIRFNLPVWRH